VVVKKGMKESRLSGAESVMGKRGKLNNNNNLIYKAPYTRTHFPSR